MKEYRFEIPTVSEANTREHWRARHRRKRSQQMAFCALWRAKKGVVDVPARITFTRHAARLLDSDNLAGAFKHIRDALAREIGIDDGDPRVEWCYSQELTPKMASSEFTVKVEKL